MMKYERTQNYQMYWVPRLDHFQFTEYDIFDVNDFELWRNQKVHLRLKWLPKDQF